MTTSVSRKATTIRYVDNVPHVMSPTRVITHARLTGRKIHFYRLGTGPQTNIVKRSRRQWQTTVWPAGVRFVAINSVRLTGELSRIRSHGLPFEKCTRREGQHGSMTLGALRYSLVSRNAKTSHM